MDGLQGQIRKLRLTARRLIHTSGEGSLRTFFHGRGIEFASLREYVPGDDIRQMEWNTTARRGMPYIKTFVEERDLTVVLAVDLSSSMELNAFAVHRVAALLTTLADYHDDRIGCLGFTDRPEFYITPSRHPTQPERILHQILTASRPRRKTSLTQGLQFLLRILKKRAILFLLSDFLDRNFERHLYAAARKHEVVGIHLYSPLELKLPRHALFEFFDPESGRRLQIDGYDARSRREYSERFRNQVQFLSRTFIQARADFLSLPAGQDSEINLLNFLRRRQASPAPLQVKHV